MGLPLPLACAIEVAPTMVEVMKGLYGEVGVRGRGMGRCRGRVKR